MERPREFGHNRSDRMRLEKYIFFRLGCRHNYLVHDDHFRFVSFLVCSQRCLLDLNWVLARRFALSIGWAVFPRKRYGLSERRDMTIKTGSLLGNECWCFHASPVLGGEWRLLGCDFASILVAWNAIPDESGQIQLVCHFAPSTFPAAGLHTSPGASTRHEVQATSPHLGPPRSQLAAWCVALPGGTDAPRVVPARSGYPRGRECHITSSDAHGTGFLGNPSRGLVQGPQRTKCARHETVPGHFGKLTGPEGTAPVHSI
jgi:hypothetical protein